MKIDNEVHSSHKEGTFLDIGAIEWERDAWGRESGHYQKRRIGPALLHEGVAPAEKLKAVGKNILRLRYP